MPGERYFAVRDRLTELLGWIDDLAREVGLDAEPDHPPPVLNRPVLIAAVGEVNAGKSSLLNALVGEELCAEGPLPLTSEVRLYRYGPEQDQPVQPLLAECRRPVDFLRNFDLLDTPGTNARVDGHQEIAAPFLEHADLVLVVFTAENPWTAATWDAVSRLSPEALSKTALVVQRIDLKQLQDIPIILGHMRDLSLKRVGVVLPIFPVAAKLALEVKRSEHPDPRVWSASRFSDLEHYISTTICESLERRQVLHDGWHHAARVLRRLEQRFDAQRRGTDDDSWFLSGVEREMDDRRDEALVTARGALAGVMERYRAEVDAVVQALRGRLGWWRTLARLFAGDSTAAAIEAAFAARMQETATAFGREDAERLVGACETHWETVRPRVVERMGVEPGPSAVAGAARDETVTKFVARLEKAVPAALANLRLRGVLDPMLRRRNSLLKGLVALGLLVSTTAGICGVLGYQQTAVVILVGSLAVFALAMVVAWVTAVRVAESYRERLLAGAATFAEGLKGDHGEAIRYLYRDHFQSLLEVRRKLASNRAALLPRMERSNSLYIALKSVELDL